MMGGATYGNTILYCEETFGERSMMMNPIHWLLLCYLFRHNQYMITSKHLDTQVNGEVNGVETYGYLNQR